MIDDHKDAPVVQADESTERRLFSDNLDMLLANQQNILGSPDYYLTPLSFAGCCVGVGTLGVSLLEAELHLGHLLEGYRQGFLVEICSFCFGTVVVTYFGANFSGLYGKWYGCCAKCRRWSGGNSTRDEVTHRMRQTRELLAKVPEVSVETENYAGYAFSKLLSMLQSVTKDADNNRERIDSR